MYWANFIHIYQPPTQTRQILERVVKESYRKILAGLLTHPQAKLTLNINAGLTEMLAENGFSDIIEQIRTLLERGQIELTASAKYHPLLPKLPEAEIQRQIEINEKTNRQFFGPAYHPKGFFPPEMAYSPLVGQIVRKLGFEWIILDEVALPEPINYTQIYQNRAGLKFFFRERATSFKILSAQLGTAKALIRDLSSRLKRKEYLLTAMDGETFGHHRLGLEEMLWEITKEPLPTITISQIADYFPLKNEIEPQNSSWALTDNLLSRQQPFIRWDDPENQIHQKQWQLVKLAIEAVNLDCQEKSRQQLDRSLYSDQFWWASARPWWSLEWIEKGAHDLLTTIENCGPKVKPATKKKAREIYLDIILTGFEWQRSGRIEKMARQEDEEIRARMRTNTPQLTREDYNQMIASLRKQMLAAAKNEEYYRAEQFKKRIIELINDRDNNANENSQEIMVNQ